MNSEIRNPRGGKRILKYISLYALGFFIATFIRGKRLRKARKNEYAYARYAPTRSANVSSDEK